MGCTTMQCPMPEMSRCGSSGVEICLHRQRPDWCPDACSGIERCPENCLVSQSPIVTKNVTLSVFFPLAYSVHVFWPWLPCRGEQVFNVFLYLPLVSCSDQSGEGWKALKHWVLTLNWSLLPLSWSGLEIIWGNRMTATSDTVKPGVKGWLSITALQKVSWDHVMLALWDGLLNGTMNCKRGLYRFLFNLFNFLRGESSRQDYTLLQQIIQMYKSYWGVKCVWVMECQTSWEQTILIMSFDCVKAILGVICLNKTENVKPIH